MLVHEIDCVGQVVPIVAALADIGTAHPALLHPTFHDTVDLLVGWSLDAQAPSHAKPPWRQH